MVCPKRREKAKQEIGAYLSPYFEYRFEGEYHEYPEETATNLSFRLIHRFNIPKNADTFVKEKIAYIEKLDYGEVEDWKIGGVGRFINICVRDLDYYIKEKRDLEERLKKVDEKIKNFKN